MANDWNTNIMAEFRANAGKVGGMFEGAPLLILHTKGAKTGKHVETPLMPLPLEDGKYAVFASQGGAPKHPSWYYNLVANPEVEVELGTERFKATAAVVDRATRDDLYGRQAARFPQFAEYEQKTTRVIPVVVLEPQP